MIVLIMAWNIYICYDLHYSALKFYEFHNCRGSGVKLLNFHDFHYPGVEFYEFHDFRDSGMELLNFHDF